MLKQLPCTVLVGRWWKELFLCACSRNNLLFIITCLKNVLWTASIVLALTNLKHGSKLLLLLILMPSSFGVEQWLSAVISHSVKYGHTCVIRLLVMRHLVIETLRGGAGRRILNVKVDLAISILLSPTLFLLVHILIAMVYVEQRILRLRLL